MPTNNNKNIPKRKKKVGIKKKNRGGKKESWKLMGEEKIPEGLCRNMREKFVYVYIYIYFVCVCLCVCVYSRVYETDLTGKPLE